MEETSSNTNPVVVVVEYPSFQAAMIQDFEQALSLSDNNERKKEMHKLESHYRTLNWITPKLREEPLRLFPTLEDIDTVNNNQHNLVQLKKYIWKHSAFQIDFLQDLINSSKPSRFSSPSGLLM